MSEPTKLENRIAEAVFTFLESLDNRPAGTWIHCSECFLPANVTTDYAGQMGFKNHLMEAIRKVLTGELADNERLRGLLREVLRHLEDYSTMGQGVMIERITAELNSHHQTNQVKLTHKD